MQPSSAADQRRGPSPRHGSLSKLERSGIFDCWTERAKGILQDGAGEKALSSYELKLPCTAEDENCAFCKRVATDKAAPRSRRQQ